MLFYLPVTKAWLRQLVLALVLICHSSLRGVIEFFRDLLDLKISQGTVHNIVKEAVPKARDVNQAQDLSKIRNGGHDEIFQATKPVLVGADLASTYCYLLSMEEHRDAETWGIHLLDLAQQGLKPQNIIADGGQGLRAGQSLAWPDIPCHADVFHPLWEFGKLASYLEHRACGLTSVREAIEKKMERAKKHAQGNKFSSQLAHVRGQEKTFANLAQDVRTMAEWMQNDILALAGPDRTTRQEMFDFVVEELRKLEPLCEHRISSVRRCLENQRDNLLAFSTILDQKLAEISRQFNVPPYLVYEICKLQGIEETSALHWQLASQIQKYLKGRFYDVQVAVIEAMSDTPRASSIIENLNSRLRNYFFLRKQLGPHYLELLRFFLNHRKFMRSERPERIGKSPKELLTGEKHPHWLELLGYTPFCRQAA